MLSEQDKCEIRKSYRNAIDPRQQVKILSQLYLVSREEILDILGPLSKSARPKPSRKGQPRRIYAPEFKAEAMQRLHSGESFRRVAEDMGVNEPEDSLTLQLLRLVRYRLEHPDYLSRDEYGMLLSGSFDRIRKELPSGFAIFHLPWMLEWYKATRQYKKTCELLEGFPGKLL